MKNKAEDLPSSGGVYETKNINLYQYCYDSPAKYTDPDGNCPALLLVLAEPEIAAAATFVASAVSYGAAKAYNAYQHSETKKNVETAKALIKTVIAAKAKDFVLHSDEAKPKDNKAKAPPANNGDAPAHGGKEHNDEIDKEVNRMKEGGYSDIRKNQAQTDVDGNKVGSLGGDKLLCHAASR